MKAATKEDILRGLACVGRHPMYQRHAYLECNLSVIDLDVIYNYFDLLSYV